MSNLHLPNIYQHCGIDLIFCANNDVEPNSEFLKDIHAWDWPKDIPYHLVISYTEGNSSDGVVPLQSQSPMRLQAEATRMYIFNDDHVGILNDNKFIETLNMVLLTALTKQF